METPSSSSANTSVLTRGEDIKCMYVDPCTTGSQLRKAISHIFGRNKLCTRKIPPHVWVHYCRKHYQRCRYRNAQNYARTQCELVQEQIHRIQAWSDENKRSGRGSIVNNWSLCMRKREQNRMKQKRRRAPNVDEEVPDADEDEDRAVLNGTAVPDWLQAKTGDGYSTSQIEEIVVRLTEEMGRDQLTQIPDIEILPNISDIPDGTRNRTSTKRKASPGRGHKRAQSEVSLQSDSQPMTRQSSHPSFRQSKDAQQSSPAEKRQRTTNESTYGDRDNLVLPQPQLPDPPHTPGRPRPIASTRRTNPLAQYPMTTRDREHQLANQYTQAHVRHSQYSFGPPLSAPIAQRSGYSYQTLPSQYEAHPISPSSSDTRVASHWRSNPDIYGDSDYTFHQPSSIGYQSFSQSYATSPPSHERVYMPHSTSFSTPSSAGPPSYYDQLSPSLPPIRSFDTRVSDTRAPRGSSVSDPSSDYSSFRHNRHQSSPVTGYRMPASSAPEYNALPSTSRTTSSYDYPTYHHRQDSYVPPRQYEYRRVEESEKTKAVYAERR
ncbi:hypothetical protein DL766_001887 [Monosporascus sp. MC13-8B]|uniref:ORP1 n=1 Tax=Monosporascus cannonballus TaxID=155416 RepID=A0ABY0GV03_9PEZI|nr:hypothetical protein DL762_008967 [Monosporascus cannonballus]RYO85395.1 hypothetical protein DL763_007111 [Monosporascus cannonballus]RYP36647.1 hypothetical protein DL766_001887 [Monosporascus sp. MC13-8B]